MNLFGKMGLIQEKVNKVTNKAMLSAKLYAVNSEKCGVGRLFGYSGQEELIFIAVCFHLAAQAAPNLL